MSTYSPRSQRSGFTLVEVAVALAIFVFGALAIVQIFPPALGVIRNNESRVTATQLSEEILAKLHEKSAGAPEAVYNVNTTTVAWQDFAGTVVGTANKDKSLPAELTETAFNNSALGQYKYIYGEPHYIGSTQSVLLNRPFDNALGAATAFYDRTVEGVQISADGYLDFSNAYLADANALDAPYNNSPFNNGGNRPPASYRETGDPTTDVTYYVSYRWLDASSPTVIKGVIEEPLSIPPDSDWTGEPMRLMPSVVNSANRIIPGGAKVLMRRNITANSNNVGGSIVSVGASVPGLYYISYLSKDWRDLTDDSAPVNNTIRLPINGIDPDTVFGVLTNSNYTLNPPIPSTTPNPPYPIASVDSKKGEVTYTFPATTAPRIRTVYRALEGWARQIAVAPRSYIPYNVNRTGTKFPRERWREYFWQKDDGDSTTNGDLNVIYFNASEAGKTLSLTFLENSTGRLVNAVCTIQDDLIDTPGGIPTDSNVGFADAGKVARLFIVDETGQEVSARSILGVQGLSLHARTAWINGDRYNQVIVPAYRKLVQ